MIRTNLKHFETLQVVPNDIKLIPLETISITQASQNTPWGPLRGPPGVFWIVRGCRNCVKSYRFDTIWNNLKHFDFFQSCLKLVSCLFCMPLPLPRDRELRRADCNLLPREKTQAIRKLDDPVQQPMNSQT